MSDQPDLFSVGDDDFLPYAGTAGFVAQPASAQRAHNEARSGEATARARAVLAHLEANPDGLTWKQLGTALNLHHGQISGALSNLHKAGAVFMLNKQRDRCHPYCHAKWRINYTAEERIDEPVKTKGSQRQQDLEQLLELIAVHVRVGNIKNAAIINAVEQLQR
jgi:hypothetical protein